MKQGTIHSDSDMAIQATPAEATKVSNPFAQKEEPEPVSSLNDLLNMLEM